MRSAARVTTERSGVFNYEDFCAFLPNKQKGDLIDGVIYMASPDNLEANDLNGWVYVLVRGFARRRKLGNVYISRVACRLDDRNAPEPDIVFVKTENLDRAKRGGIEGPGDLAIEFVSPESVERDYGKKRKQYEKFGFPEYWIVDELEKKVTILTLGKGRKYREARQPKGLLKSEILDGFWLERDWLWQRPLPDELDTLQLILRERR